jgi:hypothetical protein
VKQKKKTVIFSNSNIFSTAIYRRFSEASQSFSLNFRVIRDISSWKLGFSSSKYPHLAPHHHISPNIHQNNCGLSQSIPDMN